ncbi:hypothetical protein FJT64_004166 [Amphibalanus amphitrite]|uniref:Peptidase A2 domain-containing protein n=1 Tax=Amphibalanus amphitrite TaxID=1232801 RepID=A0A6A4VZY2_AMPAM|nr:hypothetical protein FJT64_004166 [Amphibalanus amphitrite]
MHRDTAHHLVLLVLTFLLVSAARPAPLPASARRAPPPLPFHTDNDDRRTCRRAARSPFLAAPAPLPCAHTLSPTGSPPGRSGPAAERAPGDHVTRRGRRGASARRRGCRGGRAWRRSGPGGRRQNLLAGLINIQSLLPKILTLQHEHLNRLDYDICVITETWLRPATASRLVTFPGYTLHRADRPGDAGYGGVAILVKDSYTASVIPQPASDCAACRLESLWLRVKPATGRQFSIAAVYRPPRRTVAAVQADLDELEVQFQRVLLQHSGPIFIMGDLNLQTLAKLFMRDSDVRTERVKLRRCTQAPGQSSLIFLANLKEAAVKCAFGPLRDDMIRDQFVEGCVSEQLRDKLIMTDGLTLTALEAIAEAADRGAQRRSVLKEAFSPAVSGPTPVVEVAYAKETPAKVGRDGPWYEVQIGGQPVTMMVDTGAAVSVIPADLYQSKLSHFKLNQPKDRVQGLKDMQQPSTKKLQSVLGILGFYSKFVKNFSSRVEPLRRQLRKDAPAFKWTRR